MRLYRYYSLLALCSCIPSNWAYDIVRDYSGQSFFNGWDFFGSWDNLTLGDVWWLNDTQAFAQGLAYINPAGHAILKVDNTSNVALNEKRNTVRITTKDYYNVGSLWIIDLLHIPYGCSVWPAFWTKGPLWPDDGEIDIIEAINVMDHNQMALHTTQGCIHTTPPDQKGKSISTDCGKGSGCVVAETAPNSYNTGFAAAGGGVWATQFDDTGIFMWFWSRPDVPASISQATSTSSVDISQWGPPSASYPKTSTCNLTQFFTTQQLVLDITLCGDWAGVSQIYNPTCGNSGKGGSCYLNNVVGPGSPTYDNAYFEISYVRAYSTLPAVATQTLAVAPSSTTDSSVVVVTTVTASTANSAPTFHAAASNGAHGRAMASDNALGAVVGIVLVSMGAILF